MEKVRRGHKSEKRKLERKEGEGLSATKYENKWIAFILLCSPLMPITVLMWIQERTEAGLK